MRKNVLIIVATLVVVGVVVAIVQIKRHPAANAVATTTSTTTTVPVPVRALTGLADRGHLRLLGRRALRGGEHRNRSLAQTGQRNQRRRRDVLRPRLTGAA